MSTIPILPEAVSDLLAHARRLEQDMQSRPGAYVHADATALAGVIANAARLGMEAPPASIMLFEVRDRGTCMKVLALKPSGFTEADNWLWGQAGYSSKPETQAHYVIAIDISDPPGIVQYDPYAWDNRTMRHAHAYIREHWDELQSGAVIDVQYIRGETTEPKPSDRMRTGRTT